MLNIKTIQQMMEEQIVNPARAQINCESAFIKDRLNASGHLKEAAEYWHWVCSNNAPDWVTPEIAKLQKQLDNVSHQQKIPSWWTYGT